MLGWDELKPPVVKIVKHNMKNPQAHIRNLSFDTGIYPSKLKIVPVFKSGDFYQL